MDELAFRFEKPIAKNRWDAPLFHLRPLEIGQPKRDDEVMLNLEDLVATEDSNKESEYTYFKDNYILEEINQALFHGAAPKPNIATQAVRILLLLP